MAAGALNLLFCVRLLENCVPTQQGRFFCGEAAVLLCRSSRAVLLKVRTPPLSLRVRKAVLRQLPPLTGFTHASDPISDRVSVLLFSEAGGRVRPGREGKGRGRYGGTGPILTQVDVFGGGGFPVRPVRTSSNEAEACI